MTNFLQQQLLYFFTIASSQLLNLNIFSLFRFFYLSIDFSLLTNLFLSFWLFLVLFWMLWMLVTAFKLCHVPQVSRITTWGTPFMERKNFSVPKEWFRFWSHESLIIFDKKIAKKLKAVRPKSWWEREKKEKQRQLKSVMR